MTIVDDETSLSLSASPSSVAENAGATSVTVTVSLGGNRSAAHAMPVTVTVGKTNDAAVSGTDYDAVAPFLVTIPKNSTSTSKTITFTPIDDALVEGDEALTLSGTTPKTSASSTRMTITDDDNPVVTTADASVLEGNSGTTRLPFTVKLTDANGTTRSSLGTVTASYKVYSRTGDTATAGTDYTATSGTLTFAPGTTSKTVDVSVAGDTVVEGDETLTWEWTGSTNSVVASSTATGTIRNDDVAAITLSANPSSVTEDGGARTVTVTATMASATTDTAVTIAVGKDGDPAVEGTDYATVADFTLTIAANKTTGTGTFILTPVDDDLYEGDPVRGTSEWLTIGGSATGYRVSGTSVAITDDDASTKATVSLGVKPARVKECSAAATVTVTATLPDDVYSLPEARDIVISVGKSTDTATTGTDYKTVEHFILTIPAGHHTGLATFELEPIDDSAQEGDETITVSGIALRLGVGNDAAVTIEDDDQPIVVLTMDPAVIPENNQATSVEVTASLWDSTVDRCAAAASGAAAGAVGMKMSAAAMAATAESMVGASAAEVARAVLGPGARPASQVSDQTVTVTIGDTGDTAVSGTDYTAVSDFDIVIRSGRTTGSATFTTTASLDNILEPTETLTAKGVATGTTVTSAGGHVDDKDKISPTLTVTPATVAENAGATSMTVTVATGGVAVAQSLEAAFTVSGGTATAGTDFATVKDFKFTLAAGATSVTGTFTLTPTDDRIVEGDETLAVSIPDTNLSAAVTLTDDDSTEITLTASPSSMSESVSLEQVMVTAATDGDTFLADRTVTVSVGKTTDTATSGTDYAAVSDFDITIKAGKTSGVGFFYLTTIDDTIVEGDEALSVDGTSTGLTVNGTGVTLTDNDDTEITLTASPPSVAEGDSAKTVTVTAATDGDTFAADRTVTVSVGGSNDSATSGTDYAAVADLDVTITAGQDHRQRDVHADAKAGHAGGGRGDDRGDGDVHGPDGERRQRDDHRRRPGAGGDPDGEPGERLGGRGRDHGDGDRGLLQHQHLRRGEDGGGDGGRQQRQRHLRHRLRPRLR